ncbi:hypothetical protein J5Y09_11480 [Roseomonas sp. PWR1]|uniref:Uncharacterized protein n=1 Tax=Roseomonas nitratireducens TaxID=2820810 RepID=A0ABS4AT42_9PROT|nr:hypothetical protein [Neoroseomonas nitratireducens]MBP0464528.1 hypothetical protein [Neoroseomonas nitratireducens]
MRRPMIALLLLLAAGCTAGPPAVPPTPAARHAGLVALTDTSAGRVVDHLAFRERREVEEAATLRFGAGGMPRTPPPPAVPAAGAVMDPAMDLLLIHAQRLSALSLGGVAAGDAEATAALARVESAIGALRGTPGPWPAEAARQRAAGAFRALAAPAPQGSDAAGFAAGRQGAVAEATGFLQALVGRDARGGLRAVLAERHRGWRGAQEAVLAAARNDRNLSPQDRMALWNRTQARLAADAPDVAAAELAQVFAAMPAAHRAAGAGDEAGVEAFATSVARLRAIEAQAR